MNLKGFLSRYFPLSGRGMLVFLFALWLVLFPARLEIDIVAAVAGIALLALVAFLGLSSLIIGYQTRKRLELELSSRAEGINRNLKDELIKESALGSSIFSNEPSVLVLKLSNLKLPPFFSLQLQLKFTVPLQQPKHEIMGGSQHSRFLTQTVIFPHRGEWQVDSAECSVQDRLGLTRTFWEVSTPQVRKSFCVRPPLLNNSALPVLSSASRAGEEVLDLNERRGEDFDLKPYHPSDGMRKILWKVYAKSGQLVSRHPERSMTPEGKVLLYCAAGREDDDLCGRTLAYVRRLEEIELQPIFGCAGLGPRSVASSAGDAEALLIETVWDSGRPKIEQELEKILDAATGNSNDTRIENLIIFFSPEKITGANKDLLLETGTFLERKGISPIFVPTTKNYGAANGSKTTTADSATRVYLKRALELLVIREGFKSGTETRAFERFMRSCAAKNWTVINGA